MFIATFSGSDHGYSDSSNGFPINWTQSGDIHPDPIGVAKPVVVWQGIGQCFTGNRPTTFNTVGRTLIEIDPSTFSSHMIQWDGTGWITL